MLGLSPIAALVAGFSLGLCSTPLVLQLLGEKGELTTRHGRLGFALLLFQDMAAIPVLAAIPLLAGGAAMAVGWDNMLRDAWSALAPSSPDRRRALPAAAAFPLCRSHPQPRGVRRHLAAGRDRRGPVDGTGRPVHGARRFIAGVLLADSEYRHSIEADIEPFRGLLLGLFFMAVGMTAQIGLLTERPGLVLGLTALLLAAKWTSVVITARAYGTDWRDA